MITRRLLHLGPVMRGRLRALSDRLDMSDPATLIAALRVGVSALEASGELPAPRVKTDEVAEWLRTELQAGPRSALELRKLAHARGIKDGMLHVARRRAGIVSTRIDGNRFAGSTWSLPAPATSADQE